MMKTNTAHRALGALFAAASLLMLGSASAKDYVHKDSEIRWTGSMPVKSHTGLIALKELEAEVSDQGEVTALRAVVDMSSINVTDLEGKDRDKLTGHLKSDDFFHVEAHPTATFVLKEHKDGQLRGTLTIRGVSSDIALPVTVTGDPESGWTLAGDFDFDRMDYGVDYQNSGFFGFINAAKSKLIDDMIDISATVTLAPES